MYYKNEYVIKEERKNRALMRKAIKERYCTFPKNEVFKNAYVKTIGKKYIHVVDITNPFLVIKIDLEEFYEKNILVFLGTINGWNRLPEIYLNCRHDRYILAKREIGNCYTEYTCYKCGYRYEVDSSG